MSGQQRRIIPSEELTEFQRWQFNSLLDKPFSAVSAPLEAAPEIQASVIEPEFEPQEAMAAVADEAVTTQEIANAMPYPTAEEIEAIQHQAHDEGYQAGLAEGRAQAQIELQQLTLLLNNLNQVCQQTEHALADSVLELALQVAKQVIGDEIRQHPQQLLAPIREALAAIPTASSPAKLYLAPGDLQLLQHDLRYELPEDVWRFIGDEQLEMGSCRIETPNTQLEFSLASRWKKIVGVLGSNLYLESLSDLYPSGASKVDDPLPETVAATSPAVVSPSSVDLENEPDA